MLLKNRVRSAIQRLGRVMTEPQLEQLSALRQIMGDIEAKQILQPLQPKTFLPESDWSLSSRAILAVVNDIYSNHRERVVEFGSGISTLYIGKLLQQYEGKLYSFENDSHWYQLFGNIVHREHLEDTVVLSHAPLIPYAEAFAPGLTWYDTTIIQNTLRDILVDTIVVDGPNRSITRYPAIPALRDKLAASYTILLDDSAGTVARKVLNAWEKQLDVKFQHFGTFSMVVKNGILPSVIS